MSTGTETGQRRRRRVRLTPMRSIPVEFTGERAGEGPLTLGQLNIYAWLSEAPDHVYAILCVELPVPAVVSVDDVAEATAVLIARHESLRTTYVPGEQPRQRVAAAGVQLLEVCSLGEGQWGPQDRPAVAEALVRWLRESPDPGRRPVRMAVAIAPDAGDRVIACAAAFSHLAVDHGAIEILKRDFAGLLGDPARRQAGRPGHQPLDQAELEATRGRAAPGRRGTGLPAGAVVADPPLPVRAARRPDQRRVAGGGAVVGGRRDGRTAGGGAHPDQPVQHRAGGHLRRGRPPRQLPELVFPLLSSNRFERHLVNYVGALAQGSIATVEIAGRSFDELARHTWTTVMEASRHARYDSVKRDAMDELIEHERGLRLNYDPLFNSLVPESWSGLTAGVGFQPEEIDVALARTELRWRPMPVNGTPIQFTLNQIDGCLRLDAWSADAGLVPRAELESVLLAVERLLVAAAHGDVPGGRMPELIGLEPLAGTPDRILVDHCWVDIADVQRLLDDALAPAVARVFASADGRPLVAHLAATDAVHTPNRHTPAA